MDSSQRVDISIGKHTVVQEDDFMITDLLILATLSRTIFRIILIYGNNWSTLTSVVSYVYMIELILKYF